MRFIRLQSEDVVVSAQRVGDYVLASYGTGWVMAVPAHDDRDFEFAEKFGLEIKRVIKSADGSDDSLPYCDYGVLVNSGKYDGLSSTEAKKAIVEDLKAIDMGDSRINFRVRDWLVSRQRYWGAPIPMIHCPICGVVPVPEKDLPVELPHDVVFTPDGESPLRKSDKFMNVACPKCGGDAKRDPDTLDTFVCSSWYYLRYADNKNTEKPFDTEWINKLLPVDKYIGGAEHAAMHLLYARFITKALRDMGYLNFDEPFKSLVHQGTILGTDGEKMSKTRGNVVSPDTYIDEFGSDVFRCYLGFGFNYIDGGPWSDDGIKAINRFFSRVERAVERVSEIKSAHNKHKDMKAEEKELNFVRNNSIKGVTRDTEIFQFNTSIAKLMELLNAVIKYEQSMAPKNPTFFEETINDLLRLLSPFAPHFTEEMWQLLGNKKSIFLEKWPVWDEAALIKDEVEIAIQFNGKVKSRINVPSDANDDEIKDIVMNNEETLTSLVGKEIIKVVVIKGRLINIVVK